LIYLFIIVFNKSRILQLKIPDFPEINNNISYGKVNSESDFIENSFEKAKYNVKRLIAFRVLGIKPNTDVFVRKMDADYKYKTQDIIVFKSGGLNVIHQIEE